MTRIVLNLLFALGILIALLGAGVDFLLPGASPGLNLPQVLLIVAGLLLAFGARQLRREGLRRRIVSRLRKSGVQALVITLITLIVLELILTAIGMPTHYPVAISDEPLEQAPWWTCDELGCRRVYEVIAAACEAGERSGRSCIVNRQGFPDYDDFTLDEESERRTRILMLGDSFTAGYFAEAGKSYVETVEINLPQALIWNAGVRGAGTNQAVATFAGLGPIFRPQLTVLGFFVNDFRDNLFPPDSRLHYETEAGRYEAVRHYVLDREGNPVRLQLTPTLIEYARAGKLPLPNALERTIGNTRLGSLLLQLKERIAGLSVPSDPHFPLEIERTRAYLSKLKQSVVSQGSEMLALMINFRPDRTPPKSRFETAIELMQELEIPYLDPTEIIVAPDDFAPYPDVHWNSAGHVKAGTLLSECIAIFISSGALADCPYLTLPGR